MLEGLNANPWVRPYKMLRNNLHLISPPLTETLQTDLIGSGVFPESRQRYPAQVEFNLRDELIGGHFPAVPGRVWGRGVLSKCKRTAPKCLPHAF